jgi:hypothetical protein
MLSANQILSLNLEEEVIKQLPLLMLQFSQQRIWNSSRKLQSWVHTCLNPKYIRSDLLAKSSLSSQRGCTPPPKWLDYRRNDNDWGSLMMCNVIDTERCHQCAESWFPFEEKYCYYLRRVNLTLVTSYWWILTAIWIFDSKIPHRMNCDVASPDVINWLIIL